MNEAIITTIIFLFIGYMVYHYFKNKDNDNDNNGSIFKIK